MVIVYTATLLVFLLTLDWCEYLHIDVGVPPWLHHDCTVATNGQTSSYISPRNHNFGIFSYVYICVAPR